MTYGEVRDRSLQLFNQYSLAGDKIAPTYNNQADYLVRIPALIDEAMMIIATQYRPIEEYKELRLDPTADRFGMPTYRLPDDLIDIMPGGFVVVQENPHRMFRYDSGWEKMDDQHIIFPKRHKDFHGRIFLQYHRRPRSVWQCSSPNCAGAEECSCAADGPEHGTGATTKTKEPKECVVLDNNPETHIPIPYYVAAFLVLGEDQASHYALYNQWIAMLPGLVQAPQPHRAIVEDVYRLGHYYDWGEW